MSTDAAVPALQAAGVAKRYRRGGAWALRDISLAIPTGTVTALVGPNGAGKTTLIRTFLGFERPSSGSVRVMGADPVKDHRQAIGHIGYVSQTSGLYRGLSVSDHLDLATTLRPGFDDTGARLRLEGLAIPLRQRAGELSGGQGAQLLLTIALATKAPVLLLDEPLASLDPLARHDFLGLLADEMRDRGATTLLSSHIVSDVETVSDSIVVLGDGRVMLHARIADALAGHRLAPGGDGAIPGAVATFRRPGGEAVVLMRSTDAGMPTPSLEELVMGYLAAARSV